jgi:hypothetical protein
MKTVVIFTLSQVRIISVIESRRMTWVGYITSIGGMRNSYKVSVRKPEGVKPRGRHRHEGEYNIKTDLKEMVYGDMN